MNTKIINSRGEVVYSCAGVIGHDHGYFVRIKDLSLLTANKDRVGEFEFSEYIYGGNYKMCIEPDEDDKVCPCCDRPLPKSEWGEYKEYTLSITEMWESDRDYYGNRSWYIKFRG